MPTVITGLDGSVYEGFTGIPYGPWHQIVYTDTQPAHIHLGNKTYYLHYYPQYDQYSYIPYSPLNIGHAVTPPMIPAIPTHIAPIPAVGAHRFRI
jgi:hypothetical protein